jgi:hypothetical protein
MPGNVVSIPLKIVTDTKLSASAFRVCCLLARARRCSRRPDFELPHAEIQADLDLCHWSVSRRLKELQRRRYLVIRRGRPGKPNVYRLVW